MNPVLEVLEGQLSQYSVYLDDLQEQINEIEKTREGLEKQYEALLYKYDSIQQHIEELLNATK